MNTPQTQGTDRGEHPPQHNRVGGARPPRPDPRPRSAVRRHLDPGIKAGKCHSQLHQPPAPGPSSPPRIPPLKDGAPAPRRAWAEVREPPFLGAGRHRPQLQPRAGHRPPPRPPPARPREVTGADSPEAPSPAPAPPPLGPSHPLPAHTLPYLIWRRRLLVRLRPFAETSPVGLRLVEQRDVIRSGGFEAVPHLPRLGCVTWG